MKALKGKKGLTVLFTALFLLTISFGLYGCAKKPAPSKPAAATAPAAPSTTSTTSATTTTAPASKTAVKAASAKPATKNLEAAAMKIMTPQGCSGCHIINGKGGSIGPNLDKEGTKGHSIHWLEVQINTPKVHSPNSMMPNHNLNAAQLKTVAEYLESLK
ncbi:MAG: c-type cytochrome [bacterium]